MKVIGVQLNEVEAKRLKTATYTGMDVNLNIENVGLYKQGIIIDFVHSIAYQPSIGFLRFYGKVILTDKPITMKKIVRDWKKSKLLPHELTNAVANIINSTVCLNGVYVCRSINLPAPVFPINVELRK